MARAPRHDPSAPPAAPCRRVGHSIVTAATGLDDLPARLAGSSWDMVELDVLALGDRLVVAHDVADLSHPRPLEFADALRALRALLPERVRFDVDIKGTGYELAVLDTLSDLDLVDRTLVSTMEAPSLRTLRAAEPRLALGLSVPRARRNYLAHPLTRPGAHLMLAYLRRALPGQVTAALTSGLADAIMAHWGVVTPRLTAAVQALGKELYVWTVDDPIRLAALARLPLTGVITNDRSVFERAGLGPAASAAPA
jgi:glycerophosphoryl diester phosphodiesterase